jgi:FkbM family methyltransferase
LFVELKDGAKIYGRVDDFPFSPLKYIDSRKLKNIRGFEQSGSLLILLCTEYMGNMYDLKGFTELKNGDTVVDMGAYIGIFTIKAAKAVGHEGKVISIEPSTDSRYFLKKNAEASELTNVTIIHKGSWSQKDILKFHLSRLNLAHSFCASLEIGFGYGSPSQSEIMEIEVDTLDNMLEESGVKRVDFIKMNIEGAEIETLKGMEKTLSNNDCKLAIATHIVDGKETYKTVVSYLREKGFIFVVKGDKHTPMVYARKMT